MIDRIVWVGGRMLPRRAASLSRGYRRLGTKPTFFDMVHSNNAARIRLWMALKKPGGSMANAIDVKMVTYPELQAASFAAINPLQKVPCLLRADGTTVFESGVILNYLEDKYSDEGPALTPPTPEGRQEMELLCRVHDLYIASPNTTAAGFSHSQGAMYLSAGWHGAARGMDLQTRSLKLGEIWRQLSWLEAAVAAKASRGPHLLGEQRTLADLTWFPTCALPAVHPEPGSCPCTLRPCGPAALRLAVPVLQPQLSRRQPHALQVRLHGVHAATLLRMAPALGRRPG